MAFPNKLYNQASKASVSPPRTCRQEAMIDLCGMFLLNLILLLQAEDKVAFTVQLLSETAALFEEDHSSASWEENTMENFVSVITQQADGLRSCVRHKKNKKLQVYFKRLSRHVLKNMVSIC